MFTEFKNSMMFEFDMTDLGKMKYFLDLEALQKSSGIFICQKKHVEEMLQRFGMNQNNSVQTPIVPGFKICKDEGGKQVDKMCFMQMVGCLMYLASTCPDLMFAISLLSRYLEHSTQLHLHLANRVLRYIQGTTEFGIFYKGGSDKLIAYSDSDYARDVDDKKSTTGNVFLFGSAAISWCSKKQPVLSLSTTEAKFIVAASCSCQAIWLKRLLMTLDQTEQESITIQCDSSFTIKLSRNPVMHGRSKHIDVPFE